MARLPTTREWVLMAVLAGTTIAVLYFGGDRGFGPGGREQAAAKLPAGDAPVVRMDRLVAQTEGYDPEGRNLFTYYTPPVRQAAAPPPVERPVRTEATKPIARETGPRPAPAAQAPKPPPIPFRYVGFLGPKEDKIAVFEEGPELLLARAGQVVRDRFLLVEFQYEKVVMGYTDPRFKDQTTELAMSNR